MPDIAEGISIGIEMRIFSVAPPGKRHSLAGRSRYSAPGNVAGKITRARYQLFKLRISVTEQNPAPCLAIGRNIPSKVAQQKIRLSATAGAPKKKLITPCRLDRSQLRPRLGTPGLTQCSAD